jgi:glucan biosynthesis protein C
MTTSNRRYDIDWVRVIAIGLLLIYHVAIGFQAWGIMIGFIANQQTWNSLWIPMGMLNVWRIPLLFFVSGMGVYFAIQNRNWKQVLTERAGRILIPYIFGIFCIVPIHILIMQHYYQFGESYTASPGHLWFLGNISAYVVILLPIFFYLKRNENGRLVSFMKKLFRTPLGLLPIIGAFIIETLIINPNPYELYAMTWHGFFLGLIAFFSGFCMVLCGENFWNMLLKWRWLFLLLAVSLFAYRFIQLEMRAPGYLLAAETNCWIFSVFAFAYKYLNRPAKSLTYLSQAAYPIYIVHMIFLYLGSMLIFPLEMDVHLQFILVLIITAAGCFITFEIIKRFNITRILFGLKWKATSNSASVEKKLEVQQS